MPVVLRHNHGLELNRVDYCGSISIAELEALADFNAANPTWLTFDCLSLVLDGADFQSFSKGELDGLFAKYGILYEQLTFLILRRSAWLCLSPRALTHVSYWVGGRDTKSGMSSDVRLFSTFKEAGDWLILSANEVAALESGEGFKEIARFDIAPVRRATL